MGPTMPTPTPTDQRATTIELGKGQLSTALRRLTTLDDEHLLTGIVGIVGTPRIEAKSGRLTIAITTAGEDKYLAAPLSDIIGRPVAVVLYAITDTDHDTFAADIIEPEKAVTVASSRVQEAREKLKWQRWLKDVGSYVDDTDDVDQTEDDG